MAIPPLPIVWHKDAPKDTYEKARVGRVFNARRPNRYPRAVVEATHPAHVHEAVQLANKLGCRVSVRSGGHSWAAWSVRDDAILIDLGNMKYLEVNKEKMIVAASPSTTGMMLNDKLVPEGLLFCGGHCPDVGIGGFLLQGGMGWNCKNWGWACEQIAGIDVVTAAGESLHCNETENSDLFWCARGAGPGFPAIVTRFYLKISPTSDDGNEIVAVGLTPPGLDQPCIMANTVTFQSTHEAALVALEPINSTRPPGALVEIISEPTSIKEQYADQAAANPSNHRYCAENAYLANNSNATAVLEKAFTTLPHKKSFALWFSMAPGSRRVLPDMALSMQSDHYFALYTIWEKPEDDVRCRNWVHDIMKDVALSSVGAYLGDSDFQQRKTKFWKDENAEKLMKLRKKWDPKGVVSGYLDAGDVSGVNGLDNQEWVANSLS
ncbi:hypothetical protein ONS95_006466 [Cadophora gregata]|uniref:uncharacterized protein n=1 Tax=Cadophora gregata TaxID=51156 RepID=UPI0026DC5193|nr:uncharacterized protein ONS95_006466 [Cadophora gregata]KAK0101289.1 hypothetical protein ONS95_006466 [Cadophora gregata]KAK0106701.1 hypothetical protein ONS96_004320 [Cadophora gregata f. sp. sojae]